jgi:hypothetical protein
MSFIHQACANLRPGAGVSVDEHGVHWHAITEIPSDAEIQAEAARLHAEHGGMDAWKAAIQAVKDKYPKGAA